jgi:hypothetical protein
MSCVEAVCCWLFALATCHLPLADAKKTTGAARQTAFPHPHPIITEAITEQDAARARYHGHARARVRAGPRAARARGKCGVLSPSPVLQEHRAVITLHPSLIFRRSMQGGVGVSNDEGHQAATGKQRTPSYAPLVTVPGAPRRLGVAAAAAYNDVARGSVDAEGREGAWGSSLSSSAMRRRQLFDGESDVEPRPPRRSGAASTTADAEPRPPGGSAPPCAVQRGEGMATIKQEAILPASSSRPLQNSDAVGGADVNSSAAHGLRGGGDGGASAGADGGASSGASASSGSTGKRADSSLSVIAQKFVQLVHEWSPRGAVVSRIFPLTHRQLIAGALLNTTAWLVCALSVCLSVCLAGSQRGRRGPEGR